MSLVSKQEGEDVESQVRTLPTTLPAQNWKAEPVILIPKTNYPYPTHRSNLQNCAPETLSGKDEGNFLVTAAKTE